MASVYTQQKRESPEDYKLDDWNLNSTKRRLREKLEENPFGGDVTMGNNILGRDFAWDYLHYLEDGGEYNIEGFRKFVWSPNQNKNKFFQKRFESSNG